MHMELWTYPGPSVGWGGLPVVVGWWYAVGWGGGVHACINSQRCLLEPIYSK